ncbi:WD repeat-containing protein 25 [Stylophora pistillata]|uniref:WD repeat-containing protein 25 n=1 Tax=Stylophora pistillata TaxID=50429 RepID=A0A2B4R8Z9_STYPI|nr:WD repeat-containing protein 25 [Stylophora pistillata]
MESILAYDSGSSSEESDESPKKKQKVIESGDIKVCERNNRKTEKLESSMKPAVQVRLLSSNLSESKQIANTANLSEITENDFSDRLIDDKHETHSRDFFRTSSDKNAKSPALFNSANQKTMSSSNMTGPNVKPYVSKRQRERLAQEKSLIGCIKYSALFGQVQDMAFLPGAEEFISAAEVVRRNSTDKGIMVWDFRSTAVLSNQIYQVCGYHIGCDFSPDGKIIFSGSADGKMFFYDHSTARVMRTIEAHSAPCVDVACHPTLLSWVATCGWDGQVKVWT